MLDLETCFVQHTTREVIVARLLRREADGFISDRLTGWGDVHPCFRVRGPRGRRQKRKSWEKTERTLPSSGREWAGMTNCEPEQSEPEQRRVVEDKREVSREPE